MHAMWRNNMSAIIFDAVIMATTIARVHPFTLSFSGCRLSDQANRFGLLPSTSTIAIYFYYLVTQHEQ